MKVHGQREEEPEGHPEFHRLSNCEICFRKQMVNDFGICESCVEDWQHSLYEDYVLEEQRIAEDEANINEVYPIENEDE